MARWSVAASLGAAALFLALLARLALGEAPRIRLVVSPRAALAPQEVTVLVRLSPRPEDRALDVVADGADFYRASQWTLDGANAPRLFRVGWPSVPAGEYAVTARVSDGAGRVVAAATGAIILR